MKITLDYRNPSPSHCDVAVFVNGALAGTLTLRQEEVDQFQHIVLHGDLRGRDEFLAGDPGPYEPERADPLRTCKRCGGNMLHGHALRNSLSGVPDFTGDPYPVTVSPTGPAVVVPCLKCLSCGYSVTRDNL